MGNSTSTTTIARFGGSGGYNDQEIHFINPVQQITVKWYNYVDSITFTYGDMSESVGGTSGYYSNSWTVPDGEKITKVRVWYGSYVNAVQFFTDDSSSPKMGANGGTMGDATPSALGNELVGVVAAAGDWLDRIDFRWGSHTREVENKDNGLRICIDRDGKRWGTHDMQPVIVQSGEFSVSNTHEESSNLDRRQARSNACNLSGGGSGASAAAAAVANTINNTQNSDTSGGGSGWGVTATARHAQDTSNSTAAANNQSNTNNGDAMIGIGWSSSREDDRRQAAYRKDLHNGTATSQNANILMQCSRCCQFLEKCHDQPTRFIAPSSSQILTS